MKNPNKEAVGGWGVGVGVEIEVEYGGVCFQG
jgi:hypothetical protein